MRFAALIAVLIVADLPVASWQAERQSAEPVIRVTVDLVQVDAVVTDSRGQHIADLTSGDFRVLEDGVAQKITHFSYVGGTTVPAVSAPAASKAAANIERPAVPVKALSSEQVHRTIVIIADDLGLSADDIPAVRKAMRTFVDGKVAQ